MPSRRNELLSHKLKAELSESKSALQSIQANAVRKGHFPIKKKNPRKRSLSRLSKKTRRNLSPAMPLSLRLERNYQNRPRRPNQRSVPNKSKRKMQQYKRSLNQKSKDLRRSLCCLLLPSCNRPCRNKNATGNNRKTQILPATTTIPSRATPAAASSAKKQTYPCLIPSRLLPPPTSGICSKKWKIYRPLSSSSLTPCRLLASPYPSCWNTPTIPEWTTRKSYLRHRPPKNRKPSLRVSFKAYGLISRKYLEWKTSYTPIIPSNPRWARWAWL